MPECASIAVVTTFLYTIVHASDKTMFLPPVHRPRYSAWMFVSAGVFMLFLGLIVAVLFAIGTIPSHSVPGRNLLNESLAALRARFKRDRFNIELKYVKPVTPEIAEAFEFAKTRWERVLLNNIDNVIRLKKGQKLCGQVLTEALTIENILVFINVDEIDGVGNVLATAGPCGLDSEGRARAGVMNFDSADIVRLEQSGRVRTVVLHEMGHVLGLGTLWEVRGLISGKAHSANHPSDKWPLDIQVNAAATDAMSPLLLRPDVSVENSVEYLGKEGNAGHHQIGGKGRAVIETAGGSGTAGSHWKESVYGNELMTGFINTNGGKAPISLLSVRALSDLGYAIDSSGADEFAVPNNIDEERESFVDIDAVQTPQTESGRKPRRLRQRLASLRESPETIDLRNDVDIKIPVVGLPDAFPRTVRSDWTP